MFELAWSEMLVIAIVLIVVVGPKDLPKMLRTFGKFAGKMSAMAGDFRKQFDEAMKEADLDDVRKSVDDLRSLNPRNQIRQALSPMEKAAADVRSGVDNIMRPKTSVPTPPASTEATASEPLKNGPTAEPNGTAAPVVPSMPAIQEPAPSVTPSAVAPLVASVTVPAAKKPRASRAKVEASPAVAAAPAKAASAKPSTKPTASAKPVAAQKVAATAAAPSKSGMNGTPVEKPARTRKPKETGCQAISTCRCHLPMPGFWRPTKTS